MYQKTFASIFIKIELLNNTLRCGNIYRSLLIDNYSNKIFLENIDEFFKNSKESLNKCVVLEI